jgi:signal transduction histidine kinase
VNKAFVKASFLAFAALALLLLAGGSVAYRAAIDLSEARVRSEHTRAAIEAIEMLLAMVEGAETEQRGYLLTGDDRYLGEATDSAARVSTALDLLAALTADDAVQHRRFARLRPLIESKLAELAETIRLKRGGDPDGALRLVLSDQGRRLMEQIRALTDEMTSDEEAVERARLAGTVEVNHIALEAAIVVVIVSLLAFAAALLLMRHGVARQRQTEAAATALALQLRTTLESLSQGIAVFDADHKLVTWNACFVDLLNIPRELSAPGIAYGDFVELLSRASTAPFLETKAEIDALLASGQNDEIVVFERTRQDGSVFEIRRSPVDAGGFVLTVTDQTERARAEAVLRHAQRMEAIGHLTGGVAHDFNNLLLVILGNLDLVRKRLDGQPELSARLGAVLRAAERGAALTRQLLAFARRQPLAPVAVNIDRLVEEMKGLLRRSLGEIISVEVILSAGLWDTLADAAQLESVLLNLALNARDAMPTGGKLTIETANAVLDEAYARRHGEVTPGQYVMLAITDTGIGMAPEIAARAFEPFFTTKPEGQGTGLGLSQVYGFVKQSRGHIKIYSEEGHGTTVKIYLPRTFPATAGRPQTAPVDVRTGSECILVVEDDEDVQHMVVGQLQRLGYRTLAATTAPEALEVLASGAPIDLLFTDVILPGTMRGGELAAEAKRRFPELAVLFTSGYTENSIVHGGVIDDGAMLLSKPYRIDVLAAKVGAALDKRKRREA